MTKQRRFRIILKIRWHSPQLHDIYRWNNTKSSLFGHDISLKGRLYTFSTFSAFKIHNSVSLWVKITKKPNSIGRPPWCFATKQSSNFATGCDVINRWIIGTRNKYRALLESWAPPLCPAERKLKKLSWKFSNSYFQELEQKYGNKFHLTEEIPLNPFFKRKIGRFLLYALLGRDEYVVVDMLIQRQPLKKISGTRLTNSTFLSKSFRRHTYVVSLSLHHWRNLSPA